MADQSSQVTITLLTEPDANINADGEAAAVDVQLVYLSDDSKFQAADYDQIATTALPDALGKTISITVDFSLLPDTMKTLPPVKLDEKTQFIGVIAYFPTTRPRNGSKSSRWKGQDITTACWCISGRAVLK